MSTRSAVAISVLMIGVVSVITTGAVTKGSGEDATRLSTSGHDVASVERKRLIQVAPDVNLHVVELGDSSGVPVVLLHGLSDSWSAFIRVAPHLGPELRVIAIDFRGHGESSKPVADYGMHTLARDVAAVIDTLGLSRVHVIGHSMGALVAQHLAAQRPDRMESLVLIGSTRGGAFIPDLNQLVGALAEFTHDNEPVSDEFARGFQVSTLHVPVPPEFLDAVVGASLKLPLRVWKSLMTGLLADAGPPVRRSVRTMIMWGDKDTYMPRAEQTKLVELYNASYVQFDSTGHAPHWERPEQAARVLMQFIKNEPGQPMR